MKKWVNIKFKGINLYENLRLILCENKRSLVLVFFRSGIEFGWCNNALGNQTPENFSRM